MFFKVISTKKIMRVHQKGPPWNKLPWETKVKEEELAAKKEGSALKIEKLVVNKEERAVKGEESWKKKYSSKRKKKDRSGCKERYAICRGVRYPRLARWEV